MSTPAAGAYQVVFADPAWRFVCYSDKPSRKRPEHHYATMSFEELAALPVADVAAPQAWLVMWTTAPHLEQAFALAAAWSDPANPWTYRTFGAWAKRPRGWRGDPAKWQMGTGHLFRSAVEPLLVFGRGWPTWRGAAERNLWIAPVRAHSQKPEEVRDMLRRATDGPRLEMFAADRAEGFDAWGRPHR